RCSFPGGSRPDPSEPQNVVSRRDPGTIAAAPTRPDRMERTVQHPTTRRCPDGSIDFGYYRGKAAALRALAIRPLLRRAAAWIATSALAVPGAFARAWRGRPRVQRRSKRLRRSANVPSFALLEAMIIDATGYRTSQP